MILSGTLLGFIAVIAIFLASLVLAFLDKAEKAKGNETRAKFLSRTALILFLLSFVGGVVMTLIGGIQPRDDSGGPTGPSMGDIRGRAGSPPDLSAGSGSAGPARIGKIDEAEFNKLQEKVAADSKDVKSRERLGHLYLQQQDFENVFKMAHEALQIDPKSAESRTHMGMVFQSMGDKDKAMNQFDQALQINPRHLETLMFKGIVQYQSDDLKGAKETWTRYMKLATPSDVGYPRVQMFLKTIDSVLQ